MFNLLHFLPCCTQNSTVSDLYIYSNSRYSSIEPAQDPGVIAVATMHYYFKKFGHGNTIVMPASWRPSRGAGFDLDEV